MTITACRTFIAALAIGAALMVEAKAARKPKAAPTPAAKAPLPEATPARSKPAESWSADEITAAKADCERLLSGLALDFSYAPTIRHGACGTAQPIEVRSFGVKPGVTVAPPAVMNCPMAATLARWLQSSVQPLARAWMQDEVVALKNEAAYDCRTRYNAPGQKLSEHAKANALDIGAFTLRSGKVVTVADSWGPVLRDMIKAARANSAARTAGGADSGFAAEVTVAEVADQPSVAKPAATKSKGHLGSSAELAARKAEAASLGIAMPRPETPAAIFMHGVHDSACNVFGTVLGPEANDAHREHFHIDLAPRTGSSYCE